MQHLISSYHTTSVETGSSTGLLVKLYDGIERFINEAASAIEAGDVPTRGIAINRASRIVQELSNALDHEIAPELAEQLNALYEYMEYELAQANAINSVAHLDNVRRVVAPLAAAWRELHEKAPELVQEQEVDPIEEPAATERPESSGLSLSA